MAFWKFEVAFWYRKREKTSPSEGGQGTISGETFVHKFTESFDAEILMKSGVLDDSHPDCGVKSNGVPVSDANSSNIVILVFLIEPSHFRKVSQFIQSSQGRVEVLEVAALEDREDSPTCTVVNNNNPIVNANKERQAISTNGIEEKFKNLDVERDDYNNPPSMAKSPVSKLKCTTCQCAFADTKQHRDHFKSDLHRINIKRKVQKQDPITADECDAMIMMMVAENDKYSNEMDEYM